MRMKHKPSKPVALLTIPVGIGMIAFALYNFGTAEDRSTQTTLFLAFWCLLVVAIAAINLWAAFSRGGATGITTSDEPD